MQRPVSQDTEDAFTPEPVSRRMALGVVFVSIALLAFGTYMVMKLYNAAEQAPYLFRPTARIVFDNEFRVAHSAQFIDSLESALVRGLEGAGGLRIVADDSKEASHETNFILRVGAGSTGSDVLFALLKGGSADTLWSELSETNGLPGIVRAGAGPVKTLNGFLMTLER